MVVGETHFALRADHTVRRHAAELGLLHDEAAGERGAHGSHGHELAGRNVGSAAHDGQGLLSAHVHSADVQMVGIRMIFAGEHATHHKTGNAFERMDDFLQLKAEHGEHLAQLFRSPGVRHEFFQPVETKQHILSPKERGRSFLGEGKELF